MQRALTLAAKAEGHVEPNPMVGALIVKEGVILGEGYHQKFGGPHAEIEALKACTADPSGSTLYVTLEPCCHHGKTPPCTDAIIRAGIERVVVAVKDPFPKVAGGGIEALRAAGVQVEVGLLHDEATYLLAPYLKRIETGKPWVIAKWAMTLDGKIAARDKTSKWITSEEARAIGHQLRGRVDGIVVGAGTVLADNPALTARPPGPRAAARIILDRHLRSPLDSQVFETAREHLTVVFVSPKAPRKSQELLRQKGVILIELQTFGDTDQIHEILFHFGVIGRTNLLLEGGPGVLGAFFDAGQIDEVHAFIAPKLLGGDSAPSPISGLGQAPIDQAIELEKLELQPLGPDIHLHARIKH